MPIYQIQGPDKRIYEIEGPAGASDAQLIGALKRHLGMERPEMPMPPVAPREQPTPGIGSSFGRGLEQLISTGKTAYGATFGDPRAAMESSLQRREAISAKYGESPGYEEVKKAYQERGLFPAIGEYLSQIPSAIAEQTPQIATTLGLARVGSVAGVPGAIAGAAGPSYTLAYGSLLEREAEEQRRRGEAVDPSRAKAAALAVPYAALDVAATFIPMGKGLVKSIFGDDVAKLLSRGATKEAEQLAAQKLSSESFLKSLAVGTAKGVAIEVPTEVAQQALERFQAGLPLLDKSAFAEYGQTAFEVSKLGPIGTIGRFSDKSGARQRVKEFEAEEAGRKRKEAEAAEEARRQTPEYLQELHKNFTELSTQEKTLRDELKPYQGKKGKKALAALDEEERATVLEGFDTLKELRSQLSEIGPEYKKRKPAINAMLEEARKAGMTPEEYFLERIGGKEAVEETKGPVTEPAARSMVDLMGEDFSSLSAATPQEKIQDRVAKLTEGLKRAAEIQPMSEDAFRNATVAVLMRNPALAQRIVDEQIRIPGVSAKENKTILSILVGQLKAAPGQKVAAETEALQRMGERGRPSPEQVEAERLQMRIDEERYALRNIAQDKSNPVGVNEKINDILKLLEQKLKAPAISSEVQRGVGAVESRTAGERVADREELVRLIEQFRIMQRQKGAARDDTAMTELLEKIRIAAQPVTEEVITEGETKTEEGGAEKSTYLRELNRLREEQDKAFPEALTSILEAEQFRRENPPTTQIQGPTAKATRAAVDAKEAETTKRFVDAVLQEIEANRRAADLPSITADEVKTLTGRITNILREAATRKFGAPAEAQAVLREQIDEIRREASTIERKPRQKGPEYEGRLRRQFNAPAPEGTLAERKEALRGRIEDAVAQYDLPMQDAAVLREAARMLEEGAGSKELVADLEDQMYRYSTGNMEMLPEIANQLKLDQSVRAEGEQTSLFTPGQQERADVRVMKQRRNLLERRIAERKGKKLTMEGWKAHQAEVDELAQIKKDLPAVEAGGKKAPKATTPYGKEVAPEATAFTRGTSEEFIALVTKAREAREEAAKKANKENKENRAEVPDVKRAMGVLNAHIDAMGARLQVLVNAVKQARRIAERAGRNSPGAKKIQDDIGNKLAQFVEEQGKLEGYFAGIRRYAKNREIADTTYLQILTKLGKETDAVDKKIKDLEKKDNKTKKENDALTKLKAVRRELQNESGRILELLKSEYKGIEAVINQYKAKIAFVENFFVEAEPDFGVKGGTLDILQGTSEEYLKEYINRNKGVRAALQEATELRKVFDTLLKHRADIISQLAGEERAKAAVKAAEGPTPAERVAASEAEVKRKTGLGLPGVRVERSTITGQIEDAKTAVEEANEELARLQKERDQAEKQKKAGFTKKINKLKNATIPELEQNLAALEEQRDKTKQKPIAAEPKETEEVERAKQTVTKERRAKGRALAEERTTEAKEAFEAGFNEFSLAPVVSEARKPKAATKKLSPPQLNTGMSPEQKASRLKVIVAASKKVANKFATAEPTKKSRAKVAKFDAAAVSDVIKQTVKGKKSKTVYRIGELGAKSIDPVEARRFIDQVVKGLPDSVNFHYAPTLEQAPEKFLDYLVEDGVKLAEGALIKGGVMPDGTVVIIGNAHVSQADMELTLAHELIGHYGIDTLLGKKGMEALLRAVNRRADGIMGLARDLGVEDAIRGVDDIYNQRIAAARARGASAETIAELEKARELTKLREVIADAAERPQRAKEGQSRLGKVQDFLKTLVSAFRATMYRMGFSSMMKANTSDIYTLLRKSSESFERGTIGAYRNPHGDIVFSRKPVTGANAPTSAWETVDKVVQSPQSTTDRIRSEATGIGARTAFIDRFAPLEKVAEYMKKSSQAMQMMYYARMHDQRMAWTGATVNGGAPSLSLDEKGNRIITSRGGANMQDIATELSKVKGYGNAEAVRNLFTTYLAAHRALRVGPEKLNFMGNVSAAELAEIRSIGDNIPAFVEARRLYNEYNNGLIDWLVQTGAISKELGRELTRAQDYVPYYRAMGDNVVLEIAGVKPINIGNVQQQPYLRELVGGDQKIQDFFTSALQNTSMLVDMGLRNLATKESAFALREAGLLQNLAGSDKEPKYFGPAKRRPAATNVISWRDNGKDYFAIVNTEPIGIPSELTVKGMHGTLATVGGLTKIMAIPARLLRNMVTRSPLYAARQVVRDSMTNFLLAGGNMTPVASAARELGKMYAGTSEGEKLLQERGIIGGQLLAGTSEDMQKLMLQLSRGGMGWEMTLAKLDRMHMKADASARITLYNDFRKQGLSDMEATLATLESMNFSKRGVSSSVYALNMMVPFLNAQIQGLNVLYQAFRGQLPYAEKLQIQRKIVTRGLMMTAATIAYVSMMQDDEAYKNANLRDRLNNWFIKVPGLDEPIKVPIPFEIGIIFKAIPEAALMAADKDEDATKVMSALAGVIANSSPVGISTTMPQAAKPVIEAVSNYNFFTGTNIESQYEQELLPQERFREKTSGMAKGLSNLIGKVTAAAGMPSKGVSPIMIDHLVTGYTGSVGLAIAQMLGTMVPVEGATAPAEKRMSDMPVVGSLFQPTDAAGQISQFYDKAKEYGEIKQTFDKLINEGRAEEAQSFATDYATRIAMADLAEDFKRDMGELTQIERTIKASDMSPKEKREQLDNIRQAKIQFAKAFNAASRQQ